MKTKTKRIKQVFTVDEVIHVFAAQKQQHGRSPKRKVFFNENILYSYGYHFALAAVHNGTALINPERYSATTSKHQCWARRGLNHLNPIEVPNVVSPRAIENREYLIEQIIKVFDEILSGRTAGRVYVEVKKRQWKRINRLEELHRRVNNYNRFCSTFKIKDRINLPFDLIEDLEAIIKNLTNKDKEAEKLKEKYWAEKRAQQELEAEASVEAWKRFEGPLRGRTQKIYLRVNRKDDTVESSWGARVPLIEAKQLFEALEAKILNPGDTIGQYRVDRIEAKTVSIGCHTIDIEEARAVLRPQQQQQQQQPTEEGSNVIHLRKEVI